MTRAIRFLSLLLVTLTAPMTSSAQTAPTPAAGSWRYVGGSAQHQARHRAIEAALEEIPRLFRGPVRRRIRERTQPAERLEIRYAGDQVTLHGRGRQITLPIDGSTRRVRSDQGTETLRAWVDDDGRLHLAGERDGNHRALIYDADGETMTIRVHITSERLEKPIDYRLSYRRTD